MNTSPPTAVVFDLGKVLLDFDYRVAAGRLAPLIDGDVTDVQRLINQAPLLAEYEAGRIDSREFYRRVQKALSFRGSYDQFAAAFADIFSAVPDTIALHAEVRRRGVPTYLLSNTNDLAVGHIRQRYPFFNEFDGHVLSYECGSLKPEARIYEVLETVSGRRGPELIFLDDRAENVEAARDRGWRAVLHHDAAQSRAALVTAGVLA